MNQIQALTEAQVQDKRGRTDLVNLLSMRLLVGFLGEKAQYDWWGSGFFDPTAKAFLGPVFTRSLKLAQYHGVLEAARRVHDEHLSRRSYHLFRLREETEQDLHELIRADPEMELPSDRDVALANLKGWANGIHQAAVGPVLVGRITAFPSKAILTSFAATYASAFLGGGRAYPYLQGDL